MYVLPVAMARSSFDDSAIHCILSNLWMTSCFFCTMGHMAHGISDIDVGAVLQQVVINFQHIRQRPHTVYSGNKLLTGGEVCYLRSPC